MVHGRGRPVVPAHTLAQFAWLLGSSPLRIIVSPTTTAISVRNRATFILFGRVMLDKTGLEYLVSVQTTIIRGFGRSRSLVLENQK